VGLLVVMVLDLGLAALERVRGDADCWTLTV
jgi:hypothetical protein